MSSNRPKLGVYAAVFVALLLLLALSAVLGILKISGWTGFVSGLGIAAVKTLLIAVFFMHLGYGVPILRVVACAGVLWGLMGAILIFSDYGVRDWQESSYQHNQRFRAIDRVEPDTAEVES